MEITGKIVQILPATTGSSARGSWKRQDFILETQDQFPKKVCISNWNDKVDLDSLPANVIINAFINIESREFNGKWYTDVKIWKLELVKNETASNGEPNYNQSSPSTPLPGIDDMPNDDLPF